MTVREELPGDVAAVRAVNDAAFGRPGEGRLVDRLRAEGCIVAALVAVDDDCIVGTVTFSTLPISTAAGTIASAALAPVAVMPSHQRRGIARTLIDEGLRTCKDRGIAAVLVLGDPQYYTKAGFSPELAVGVRGPYSGPAWMALELVEGVLRDVRGSVRYPAAFDALG